MHSSSSQAVSAHSVQPVFATFAEFSAYLEKLGLFRMQPGLGRMESMLARVGLKRPPYAVVQVAGTNGKGSTCTMLESLARTHDLRTGLHTSPHFLSVRERVRIQGRMLPENAWTSLANKLMRLGGEELSYFEFVTCLAVLAFAEEQIDIAIMETGLGGSFDATSALMADMVVFTPFSLDHQAILGPTLHHIAADKAGCIRFGKPAVSAQQAPEAAKEIAKVAEKRSAPLQFVDTAPPLRKDSPLRTGNMRLRGAYQSGNIGLALASWRCLLQGSALSVQARSRIQNRLNSNSGESLETAALSKAWLPGRMHSVSPLPPGNPDESFPCSLGWPPILLDGAHNGHGLGALGLSLAQEGIAPAAVIFSCLADKDLEQVLPHLRVLATGPVFIPPIQNNPRAMPPRELAALTGLHAVPVESLAKALEEAAKHMAERVPEVFRDRNAKNPLLICGSLYLLGEFFALRPECLNGPAAQ